MIKSISALFALRNISARVARSERFVNCLFREEMMNQNPFKGHFIVKLTSLLMLAALTFNNAAALPLRANIPHVSQTQAALQALLQFSAEGHILGFTANGMYAADGS